MLQEMFSALERPLSIRVVCQVQVAIDVTPLVRFTRHTDGTCPKADTANDHLQAAASPARVGASSSGVVTVPVLSNN